MKATLIQLHIYHELNKFVFKYIKMLCMFSLQTREVGHWLFDEGWPGDQAHPLWTALLQPLQQQPRRWSQIIFRLMGLCHVLSVIVFFVLILWRIAVKLWICIIPHFWNRIHTVIVFSCEERLLLQSSGGDWQVSVNDQRNKTTAWTGDKESGGFCLILYVRMSCDGWNQKENC